MAYHRIGGPVRGEMGLHRGELGPAASLNRGTSDTCSQKG